MKRHPLGTLILGLIGLSLVWGGMGCSKNPLAAFEPEIVSAPDNFEFQATGLTGVTETVSRSWENSGTQATIDHSSAVTGGTTLLELLDHAGTVVYSDVLKPSVSEQTAAGISGTWTVRVTLTDTKGTLNFRAQKL